MAQITVSEAAQLDVLQAIIFLAEKDAAVAHRAGQSIRASWSRLAAFPESAPQWEGTEWRKLFTPFGKSGYTTTYHYNKTSIMLLFLRLSIITKTFLAITSDHKAFLIRTKGQRSFMSV